MAQLIQKIEGSLLPYVTNNVNYVTSITGVVQEEDYIFLNGYVAYLQDFVNTEYTQALNQPLMYGLPNINKLKIVTIEIDY